jgi:hypothetical protein
MPDAPNQYDIDLYNLVHEMLVQVPVGGRGQPERRRRSRKPFTVVQSIAPVRGQVLPPPDQFHPVRCQDLNEGGFSFLLPRRPDFRDLVVRLGNEPDQIPMLASVAHCREVFVWPSGMIAPVADDPCRGGMQPRRSQRPTRMFQVGCRFVRRLG